jgi:GNAT superfamily N-acetyltransferase
MSIRKATRQDNDALCALEARVPLDSGDSLLYIERTDFFALHRLQERNVVMVAEEDGEIIGACAGALNEAPLAGERRLLLYIHHERIAEEHQRKGIGGALTGAVAEYWKAEGVGHIDSSYWLIAEDNTKSLSYANRAGKPWPVYGWSASLAAGQGSSMPRQVGAGPIFDIVRLINRTHEGKDLFTPYEQVEFGKRLSRSLDYGWGDIYGRFLDGRLVAVAGVWDSGKGAASRLGDGPLTRSLMVADYGYEAGAEAEMAALLRDICSLADRSGRQSVRLFAEPGAGLDEHLSDLSPAYRRYVFYAPRVEAPLDPAPLYVDPVLF